jgi:PIN domain nuclease of toxin-antitoxin system
MKLLLDSHALIWSLLDTAKLPAPVRKLMENPVNDVLVSSVSFWEIALKHALGKLVLENTSPEELKEKSIEAGFKLIALEPQDAASFHKLPKLEHKDPFDRMLVWQAIQGGYTLLARDPALRKYEVHGLTVRWR